MHCNCHCSCPRVNPPQSIAALCTARLVRNPAAAHTGCRPPRKSQVSRESATHILNDHTSLNAGHFLDRLPAPFLGGCLPRRRSLSSLAFALHHHNNAQG